MKFIFALVVVVALAFIFKDNIQGVIAGELKHLPPDVEKYNANVLSEDYFADHGSEAIELKGICMKHTGWRNEGVSKNFAQNCLKAEAIH
ncbi:MAG: hypothetical protein LBS73_04295 [Campylobacteraceae bacterium]|jgi:hypothetical protein|nr:hypothetical protein [Campylobacteraceae bacterium]